MLPVCQEHQPARFKRNSFIFIISSLSLSVFLWMPGHPPRILRWTQVFISESSLANTTKLDANTQTCAHTPSLLLLTPVKAIVSDRRGGHAADVGMVMKCETSRMSIVIILHTSNPWLSYLINADLVCVGWRCVNPDSAILQLSSWFQGQFKF